MHFTEDISMIKTETEDSSCAVPSARQNSAKGQMSSFLPPCRVCGDKASGFHYGANTCEACKGFFRRSIVREQKDEDFSYRCVNGRKCILTAGKVRLCAYCRYKKCLAIGMSKRAIKQGRYTHERRTQYINEVKSKCDKKTEPITDNSEACRLVNNLMVVQQKYMTHKDLQIYDANHNYRTGDIYSDEKQILRNIVDTLENSVTLMVEFMRCIPGFTQLHLQDQSELLKGSHSDFYLLGEINTSLLDHCQQNRTQHFYKCPVHHLYSFYKLQDVYKFMKKSKELNITKEEASLLRSIAVLSPDRVDLCDPYKVEQIQWYCVNCLRLLLTRSYENPNQRLWQLLDRNITLRTLSPDY